MSEEQLQKVSDYKEKEWKPFLIKISRLAGYKKNDYKGASKIYRNEVRCSMKYLVVIDVQNDFVDGSLGTKEAQAMLPQLLSKVESFDGAVWMTKDTHPKNYLETQEGKNLPVEHCIKGTDGWEFPEVLASLQKVKDAVVYEKPTFGSVQMAEDFKKLYEAGDVESIELAGLCTDICVISNALMLKATMPELPIFVDPSCCAGVTPEKHAAALEVMASCQIKLL